MEIRKLEYKDAKALVALMYAMDEQTKFMLYAPGERRMTVRQMEESIANQKHNGSVMFGAFAGKELLGYILGQRNTLSRTKHKLYIVIGIDQQAAGRGLGTQLFAALEAWVATQQGISRLELTVMSHNQAAIALYRKFGFEVEGESHCGLMVDGQCVNEYFMYKLV
ncbi:GNAT family N-acetyltransferase [Culicoidibacter larvae]|nr:GNAT family protein [Culicoidibacter larvae]